MSTTYVEMAGARLAVSNMEKDLYPYYGFTKAEVLDYYRRMADVILPHLGGRALTLKRYPEGTAKPFFYEKRCPSYRPVWVRTARIAQDRSEEVNACLVNDLPTLMWVGNLASLELHVPLARVSSQAAPDAMVFDLDPGLPATVVECGRVALVLKELLSRVGLASFVKTSGQKGLHVLVPLNRMDQTFGDTKQFSRSVAEVMQRHHPELVTANMAKDARSGKVFINWSQNDAAKTMIAVYSLRAREMPAVSFPLAWDELERLVAEGDPLKFRVLHAEAIDRIVARGDLFREVLVMQQKLPHL